MNEEIFEITPNKEKAKSISKMAETRLEMLDTIDPNRFPSLVLEGYYEVIKELITAILLLDGFKTLSHKALIEHLNERYKEFNEYEISLLDELRVTRNKITYAGFFIKIDYLERKKKDVHNIISKLKEIIKRKLD